MVFPLFLNRIFWTNTNAYAAPIAQDGVDIYLLRFFIQNQRRTFKMIDAKAAAVTFI